MKNPARDHFSKLTATIMKILQKSPAKPNITNIITSIISMVKIVVVNNAADRIPHTLPIIYSSSF
jgi:hypothetical protein